MTILTRDKSFYKKILMIGAPISMQQIITVGVNLMDNVMLGQVNETVLAASAMGGQVHIMFNFMCMGMGMGAAVLVSRFWGAGDRKNLGKALTLMYRFCLVIAALYTVAVALVPYGILQLLTSEPEVIGEGMTYLKWSLPCFLLYGLSLTTTIVLRNSGKMNIPLYTSVGAFFVNIFFNWVFIFGKFGAPAMGIAGAALGTTISRVFEFAIICGYFFLKDQSVAYRVHHILQPAGDLLGEYIRISLPVMISDTLLGIGNSMVMAVAGHVGATFMAANTITNVVQQIATVFSSGLGQSALIITGNTLGEGKPEKARQQGWSFFFVGLILGFFCCLLILAIGPVIVGHYKISTETHQVAMELMHSVAVIVIFMMLGSILTKGVLRGGGDTTFLMLADVIFLWVVSVPLGAAAGLYWHWPPFWILFALRIDNLLKTILCLFRMRTDKWIKKIRTNDKEHM